MWRLRVPTSAGARNASGDGVRLLRTYRMSTRLAPVDYVLGRTDSEYLRLIRQAAVLRPSSERFLRASGLGAGMRVLDVGCGVGDVSFLVADVVGPTGSVLGVDVDEHVLSFAEQRRTELKLDNVSFLHTARRGLPPDDVFDAVVGRLVLMYQPDPTETLRQLAAHVRPDGIVAFQELASASVSWQLPNLPLFMNVMRWIRGAFARSGAHANLGFELYARMCDAGLDPASPIAEIPLSAGAAHDAHEGWAALARSLAPKIIEYGLATERELDIATLGERLRTELLTAGTTVPLFSGVLVGQSARRTQS
jgi:SAM-dependent methyltransferase